MDALRNWFEQLSSRERLMVSAAGLLIVREAGGLVDGVTKGTDPRETGDVIAANGDIFDAFAKELR